MTTRKASFDLNKNPPTEKYRGIQSTFFTRYVYNESAQSPRPKTTKKIA